LLLELILFPYLILFKLHHLPFKLLNLCMLRSHHLIFLLFDCVSQVGNLISLLLKQLGHLSNFVPQFCLLHSSLVFHPLNNLFSRILHLLDQQLGFFELGAKSDRFVVIFLTGFELLNLIFVGLFLAHKGLSDFVTLLPHHVHFRLHRF
jgi:hypothetical protein